jgi:hypothetical protein
MCFMPSANWKYAVFPALALGITYSMASPMQTEQVVRLVCNEVLGPATADKDCHHSNIEDRAASLIKWISIAGPCVSDRQQTT